MHAERKPREPSLYNLFVRDEIPRLKAANPSLDHKSAFKLAASNVRNLGFPKP